MCAEKEHPGCVFVCVFVLPFPCMHRGIAGDSQEQGYLLCCPGDLSVLTSSPSRLRCSCWRLPEWAEIDGEHGGRGGPAEFWTEPERTGRLCCQQTPAPLPSLLSPLFLSFSPWLFFIALLLFLPLPPLFLSVILTLPAFLFFCHSLPPHSPTSLTTALHLPLTNPTQDAVSAALADLDVMKLQVCQCCVCVCIGVRRYMLTINNSLFKMGGREVSWEMNAPVNMCECVYECQCGSCSTCKFQPTEKNKKETAIIGTCQHVHAFVFAGSSEITLMWQWCKREKMDACLDAVCVCKCVCMLNKLHWQDFCWGPQGRRCMSQRPVGFIANWLN